MTSLYDEEIISTKPRWKRLFVCIFVSFGLFTLLCVSPDRTQYIVQMPVARYSQAICAESASPLSVLAASLLNGRCTSLLRAPVSEMTYTVSSGTLNSAILFCAESAVKHQLTERSQ